MVRKAVVLAVLFTLIATMAACGSGGDDSAEAKNVTPGETGDVTSAETVGVTLDADYDEALPVPSQLAIGTLMLEDTNDAVTVEQASELLPSWKMLQALQSSGTAAQMELDAVINQIQGVMTDGQLLAIKAMELTPTSMMELAQERGLGVGRGTGGGAGGMGGFRPPAGVNPGGGPGGGMGPGGAFGGQNLDPEEMQAEMAERLNTVLGAATSNLVISMLEARAEGETWEVATPNQNFVLQRTLFEAITEVVDLERQEIMAQVREGKSLREVVEANGAGANAILDKVVSSETERVDSAVADGSMTRAEADEWLTGLKERVKEMLDGTFEFGGRGASGTGSEQP
jgi:hypothetical protein